jgi:hypothetical protein
VEQCGLRVRAAGCCRVERVLRKRTRDLNAGGFTEMEQSGVEPSPGASDRRCAVFNERTAVPSVSAVRPAGGGAIAGQGMHGLE